MEYLKGKRGLLRKNLIYKALLFIVTVALIVYFLPRDGKFNYQFDMNKPWKYAQLIATFDFPIYKSESVVKHEKDSLMEFFQPYYTLNKSVEKEALEKLKRQGHANLKGIPAAAEHLRYIEKTLKRIYAIGIVSTEDKQKLEKDSVVSIMIIDDKLANPEATENLFTVKKAYEYLLSAADSLPLNLDILRQCAMNEYIAPNLSFDRQRTQVAQEDIFKNYSWASGLVVAGQKIVDRGEIGRAS